MKEPVERTKVVVRKLPPAITQAAVMEQIDGRFSGRYKWLSFRPGKSGPKNQLHSCLYIDFNNAEDAVEFASFFNNHRFVNEKGAIYQANVEYAPSQRVPKTGSKKDGREGTISRDPEYIEFLELIAKPVENLPSAEIQLERREAERSVGGNETPIITPLMLYVRQRRAAKNVSQRVSINGKITRRAGGVSTSLPSSSRRGSDKRRAPTSMYVLRDSGKNPNRKEKSPIILVSRQGEQQLTDKSLLVSANGTDASENENAISGVVTNEATMSVSGANETGRKRVVLLKGKEREASSGPTTAATLSGSSSSVSATFKQIHRHEVSEKIRSILTKEARHSDQLGQATKLEKDRRPPRPPTVRLIQKDHISTSADGDRSFDDKAAGNNSRYAFSSEKHDKRTRNRERSDRGVWAPLRRSDGPRSSDDSVSSSSSSINTQILSESLDQASITQQEPGVAKIGDSDLGNQSVTSGRGDMSFSVSEKKGESTSVIKSGETRIINSARANISTDNGFHRHGGRRGSAHAKEIEGPFNVSEGKHSRRGVVSYGSHEKQIWVQKTGSA